MAPVIATSVWRSAPARQWPCGPSGSGKSTLADIVIGLLRPDTGTVEVDGIELTKSNLAGWRSQIGYVSQDTVLFHDTLRANLAWARGDVSRRRDVACAQTGRGRRSRAQTSRMVWIRWSAIAALFYRTVSGSGSR